MSSWLSTRQTANRLGVSEASVRRWSDRGVLPVRRVGKRGERRFKSEHVERFKAPTRSALSNRSNRSPAPHLVLGGYPVKLSTHVTAFYDSDAARTRLTTPFLAEGIAAGQPCFLMARDEELESYISSLARMPGVDVQGARASGVLTIGSGPGATTADALEFWEQALWAATDRHATVIRVVGEMASVREGFISEEEMLAYEANVNMTLKRFPCVAICQYDVRKFSGRAIISVLRAHPDILDLPLSLFLK
jgi:excisionase family DNA binding protein